MDAEALLNMARTMSKRYPQRHREDLVGEALLRYYRYADRYNPERGTPGGFARLLMQSGMLDYLRRSKKNPEPLEFVDSPVEDPHFELNEAQLKWAPKEKQNAVPLKYSEDVPMSAMQRKVCRMFYVFGIPLSEINVPKARKHLSNGNTRIRLFQRSREEAEGRGSQDVQDPRASDARVGVA